MSTPRPSVAIVTGGASGIGAALGRALAKKGHTVILADRQGDEVQAEAERIRSLGGQAEAILTDVRDADAVAALVSGVVARHGRIDLLFNNAGIAICDEATDLSLEDWRQTVEVNLMGVIHGVHAAYPHMVRQRSGHIINTSSMAGLATAPFQIPYAATKRAVVGLSRSLRIEAKHYGVRVSVLCPGVIRTPILHGGRYWRILSRVTKEQWLAHWESMAPMDVDLFASRVLRDVERNCAVIIYPWFWRLLYYLERFSPSLIDYLGHFARKGLEALSKH